MFSLPQEIKTTKKTNNQKRTNNKKRENSFFMGY
jgi:hypothetical protein